MTSEGFAVRAVEARRATGEGWFGFGRAAVAVLLALLAPGCSEDTSALFGPAPADGRATASTPYDPENDGPIVARLRLPAPAEEDFLLRATLPVPEQMHFDGASRVPFAVISSSDPTASITQVETVTRYADDGQGSDVVELLSHVRRPDVAPGTEIEYDVVYSPHTPAAFERAPSVQSLVESGGSIRLRAQDPFGHRYEMDPLRGLRTEDADQRVLRQGPLVHEVAEVGALTPLEAVSGGQGTLPRLMGVTAYVRTFAREDYLALDLHVHNGYDGQDPQVEWDATLVDLYFRSLELQVPEGWVVLHLFDSPFVGAPQAAAGGARVVPLVRPLAGGRMHLMHRQSQFTRRLMIARPHAVERARSELEHRGLAFCIDGTSPEGDAYWSWWNPVTARYLPQNGRLPDLSGMTSRAAIDDQYRDAFAHRSEQLRSGAGANYPVEWGNMGWAHPWGIQYGGMTGGDGIDQIPGVDITWSGSQEGYRLSLLRGRMSIERQPYALIASDGHPTRYEDHVVPAGLNGPYLPFSFSMMPSGQDYFGFDTSPSFQAEHCQAAGLKPHYEDALRGFMPHDLQHFIRFTSDLYIQQWLGNDSLAKAQLRLAGELFRMTHHETYDGNYAYTSGLSLKFRQQRVLEHPGTGIEYGRGEGWGLLAATGAYAAADDALRARFRPWLAEVARVVHEGQSTCTGNITAIRINKHLSGLYRTRQSFEHSFVVNALESMRRTVFEDVDAPVHAMLGETVVEAARSTIRMPFWDPAYGGQRKMVGVGMSDMSTPDFCANLPANADYGTSNIDFETPMTAWAYAYRISGDGEFLQRASESFGATGHLESELEYLGMGRLIHSAFLLGLVQELGGTQ
ncbi:MAG: hypothetical protein AAGB93_07365 [Planctomycetota bacterium]